MRLFTGIAIPPEVAASLAAMVQDLRGIPDVKWSPVEKLHITTAFIGDWPEPASLVEALTEVRSSPIEVQIRGMGWMPGPGQPRALYAGVEPSDTLHELASATARALARVGVKLEDRIYRPHVTLARVRGRLKATVPLHANPIASFMATSFFLYLSADGKYTKLEEFSFLNK